MKSLFHLLSIALLYPLTPARAQSPTVTEAWVQRYNVLGKNSDDQAFTVASDARGDIIVAGYTDDRFNGQDILTIKYSGADGSVVWSRRYNGPANGDDQARAL